MSIWSPMCWLTEHDWIVFRESDQKVILKCRFCGKFKTINKK